MEPCFTTYRERKIIMECLFTISHMLGDAPEGDQQDRRAQVWFLIAIPQACKEALQSGERCLPFCKEQAAQTVLDEMDHISEDPVPHHLFSLCTEAITFLRRMKPCFTTYRERKIIMECLFSMGHVLGDTLEGDQQVLQNMLREPLAQKPSLEHLIHMVDELDVPIPPQENMALPEKGPPAQMQLGKKPSLPLPVGIPSQKPPPFGPALEIVEFCGDRGPPAYVDGQPCSQIQTNSSGRIDADVGQPRGPIQVVQDPCLPGQKDEQSSPPGCPRAA
ncbi:uncharacterized protein LOC128329270 [Hemicordylus capensis]|uniref:uncharacterized protein LOC128329270 n=1 Tax=Hemicordylus capensis TaxID=884348 RepID=UPI0023022454|nr:uncharacterized protein LOC128329270 [Hemicordylus capensis]